jgi:hypothetical protein
MLLQIAREEMGHLITVQNLLNLLGGPLNLGRDRAPYASEIYPFRFALEPVTVGSLAKYVTAESPANTEGLPDHDLLKTIDGQATAANDGHPINHVGRIFERLEVLLGPGGAVADTDFRIDTADVQAVRADWGYTAPPNIPGAPMIVASFPGTDPAALRAAAFAAVKAIGDQGEGFGTTPRSHFERFLDVYKSVSPLFGPTEKVTWPVATNPSTAPDATTDGQITEPRAKAWAQLFDLRYRMLLGNLAHFLRLSQKSYVEDGSPQRLGDRTARGLLLLGTFDEMRHLRKIAGKLVQMPKDPGGSVNAGPPFELPYTLSLPDGEAARWRMHLDAATAATALLNAEPLTGSTDPFLLALKEQDLAARKALVALAAGAAAPPADSLPTGFAKAVTILEEAVRGFDVVPSPHGRFWAEKKRDEFAALPFTGDGSTVPDDWLMYQRLTQDNPPGKPQMPKFRPPVPPPRLAYLAQWIKDGAPDNTDHPGQVGVHGEPNPAAEPPPA